jgi:2-C-methyl-D-erythritol 4-phosphate cytidylyltransferase/2-C-methyl-D-erythritol 2,4-cyclodiphosphate synthase
MSVAVLIVAAGKGTRFGEEKQFVKLDGITVVERAIDTALAVANEVVVALPDGASLELSSGKVHITHGKDTRSGSVRAAFDALRSRHSFVLVHDAARPKAPVEVFEKVIASLAKGNEVVVPVLPVHDTVKRLSGGLIVDTLDRSSLGLAQTPQGFTYDALKRVIESGVESTDEASIAEGLGIGVAWVEGDPRALKLTTKADLSLLSAPRVGFGYDIHPFSDEGNRLHLGGIEIDHPGLKAHSDGDVAVHALADAMLGAAGCGGLGDVFPDSDPRTRGVESLKLLDACVELVRNAGFRCTQADVTIVAKQPKLASRLREMGKVLSEHLDGAFVTVKAKHPEGLGDLGKGLGMEAFAVVLLAP